MKDRIGTALWVAGAIICAWALSVSLSMMFDFTIEEARQNFRQGSFIFGAAVVFAFVFRSKVQTWGAFEKFLIYALVPSQAFCSPPTAGASSSRPNSSRASEPDPEFRPFTTPQKAVSPSSRSGLFAGRKAVF